MRSSLCQPLQGLQKIELFFLHLRAVPTQRCVQFTSLDVTPDLSSNRFCSGNRHRIIPTAQAIDPLVFSIDPHPDHDAAVVPPQRRPFPQDPAPPLSSGLSAPPPEAKPKTGLMTAARSRLARLLAHCSSAALKPPIATEIPRMSITSSP